MKIHSVFDPEFARYGRVMSGYDLEPLLATLEAVSPMPETGTAYVAEQPELDGPARGKGALRPRLRRPAC